MSYTPGSPMFQTQYSTKTLFQKKKRGSLSPSLLSNDSWYSTPKIQIPQPWSPKSVRSMQPLLDRDFGEARETAAKLRREKKDMMLELSQLVTQASKFKKQYREIRDKDWQIRKLVKQNKQISEENKALTEQIQQFKEEKRKRSRPVIPRMKFGKDNSEDISLGALYRQTRRILKYFKNL